MTVTILLLITVCLIFITNLVMHFLPNQSATITHLNDINILKLELLKVETRYYEQQKLIEFLKEKK